MDCKKILVIDPGAKNMGYALVSNENNKIKLSEYGIINLHKPPKCDLCDKPSYYFSFENIEMVYCCEAHKENFEGIKMACKSVKKTFSDLTDFLIKKCKETFNELDYDLVIIENQPAFKNPHIKSVQIILYSFFKMINKNVILQNPCVKLYGKKFDKTISANKKYRLNKKFSVECAKALLDVKEFDKIKELGKVDDVSDCINHAVAYLYKNKELPESIQNLL